VSGRGGWRRVFRIGVGRGHLERDVDEEIAFHLAMRAGRLEEGGADPESAARGARERFGDVSAVRDELLSIDRNRERRVRRGRWLESLRRDAAYAARALRRHAGFAIVVVVTLGLGIGANTAIFSLVEALLLRSIPVSHPERLVALGNVRRVNSLSVGSPRTDLYSYPLYRDLREHNTVFTGLYANGPAGRLELVPSAGGTASGGSAATASGGGSAPATGDHPRGRAVSANYFDVLGVHAAVGRVFLPDEDRVAGAGAVMVISDAYWHREFGGDPGIVGRRVSVNHVPLTIVGVTPPRFTGDIVAQRTDLWIPVSMEPVIQPPRQWLSDRGSSWLLLMGRRKPGVSLAQARQDVTSLTRRMLDASAARDPEADRASRSQYEDIPVASGARGFSYWRDTYARSLYTLLFAVALVLLIVCANVANLLLGRAAARGQEIGVRLALGAGRGRIVQQLLVECLLLSVAGAALGLLLAHWGIDLLLRVAAGRSGSLPIDTRLGGRVLLFTAALAVGTTLLFGLAPALRATRADLAGVLRTQTRGIGAAWRKLGAGRILVVAQVALSLMMLVATGMVVRSLRALETGDMGLDRDHLLLATVDAEKMKRSDAELAVMRGELAARLHAIPGVEAVTWSQNGIFSGTESSTTLAVPGARMRTQRDSTVHSDDVGPGYFHAIGAPMLRGRDFTAADGGRASPAPAIVNRAFVDRYLPEGDAIGRTFTRDTVTLEVVGVAADVHDHDLRGSPSPRVYFAMGDGAPDFSFEVRASGDPASLVPAVRRALVAGEPSLEVDAVDPLRDLTRESIRQDILLARFVGAFGILALVLAAMGLYGIMSYATLRRTGEFGLRLALGATPAAVLRLVLRDGLVLIAIGIAAGAPLVVVAMRLLRSQLYRVSPLDPVSVIVAILVLGVSALVAGLVPALRAARVGPLEALRSE